MYDDTWGIILIDLQLQINCETIMGHVSWEIEISEVRWTIVAPFTKYDN